MRIGRCAGDLDRACSALDDRPDDPLVLYGSAALLDTFYTGVEKVLARVARTFGDTPQGGAWHRELLEASVLDVPGVRPPVLREASARAVEPLLAFRHRFRNLYLFELDRLAVRHLIGSTGAAWPLVEGDLRGFAGVLRRLAGSA